MEKSNLWYIVLFPIIVVLLAILSALGLSDIQFKQFDDVHTNGVPSAETQTTR